MTERKATIKVTGEVSEKDFEKLVSKAAKAVELSLKGSDVSIAKRQTPGEQFEHGYQIDVTAPEPEAP